MTTKTVKSEIRKNPTNATTALFHKAYFNAPDEAIKPSKASICTLDYR